MWSDIKWFGFLWSYRRQVNNISHRGLVAFALWSLHSVLNGDLKLCSWLAGASAGRAVRLHSKGVMACLSTQSHLLVSPQESFVFALLICDSVCDKHTLHLSASGQGTGSQGEQAHYILPWLCTGVTPWITAVDFCGNLPREKNI